VGHRRVLLGGYSTVLSNNGVIGDFQAANIVLFLEATRYATALVEKSVSYLHK
jgi:hypothetical protein